MKLELLIALTLWLEAGGEPPIGKLAVASVIYNRAAGDTNRIEQVILAPKQFSVWNNRNPEKMPKPPRGKSWRQCQQIAKSMLNSTFQPMNDWNHYYAPALCNPQWGQKLQNRRIIGRHTFGTL